MNRQQRRAFEKHSGMSSARRLDAAGLRDFESAVRLMQSGRWQESEYAHEKVLVQNPRHSPALHHLGLVAYKLGNAKKAIDSLRLALEVDPQYTEARLNLAVVLNATGARTEALVECRRVLDADPRNALAHAELGNILKALGDAAGAVPAYRQALRLRTDLPGIEVKLAQCCNDVGDAASCALICQRILNREPSNTLAQRLLVRACVALSDTATAMDVVAGNAALAGDLVSGLIAAGKTERALNFLNDAIARSPEQASFYILLGKALYNIGRLDEAFAALKGGLDRDPNNVDGYHALGSVLNGLGSIDGALTSLWHTVSLDPEQPGIYTTLGNVLQSTGRYGEAIDAFKEALKRDPGAVATRVALFSSRRYQCDWDGLDAEEAAWLPELRACDTAITPFMLLGMPVSNEDLFATGARYARQIKLRSGATSSAPALQTYVKPSGRIRLAYLSSDYGNHATSMLLVEAIERHNRERFEVTAYCHSPDDGSEMRRRITSAFDRFSCVRDLGHGQVAQKIREDGIEILVDLKGYTRDARQEIMALRPAPVQVGYLGYPATTGADYLDYMIADSIVAPFEHQPHYSERLVHLRTCYQPNDRERRIDPAPVTRADCGLPETGFVFCSFNNSFKLNRRFFTIWMDLLQQVPGSTLWLLQKSPYVRDNLLREASLHGIDQGRIVFAAQAPIEKHLARHAVADLFLDSLPCTAHTTASDAVWAGLPLLTCLGETFAGRVAASILHSADMDELVTRSIKDYAATALRLARDPAELQDIRAKLRDRRLSMPLYDTQLYLRELEGAFTHMSRRYRAGEPPHGFTVSDMDID